MATKASSFRLPFEDAAYTIEATEEVAVKLVILDLDGTPQDSYAAIGNDINRHPPEGHLTAALKGQLPTDVIVEKAKRRLDEAGPQPMDA